MAINMSYMNLKYYINKEKRTVVCVVWDRNCKVVGKAKCCETDEFDIDIGKTIARNRAAIKYQTKQRKQFLKELARLNKQIDSIQEKLDLNEQCGQRFKEMLEKQINGC